MGAWEQVSPKRVSQVQMLEDDAQYLLDLEREVESRRKVLRWIINGHPNTEAFPLNKKLALLIYDIYGRYDTSSRIMKCVVDELSDRGSKEERLADIYMHDEHIGNFIKGYVRRSPEPDRTIYMGVCVYLLMRRTREISNLEKLLHQVA
jgi:hypothetical protein